MKGEIIVRVSVFAWTYETWLEIPRSERFGSPVEGSVVEQRDRCKPTGTVRKFGRLAVTSRGLQRKLKCTAVCLCERQNPGWEIGAVSS
jgi:hypothetical protein